MSEYQPEGFTPAGIARGVEPPLKNGEKLALLNLTGQDQDIEAPIDPRHFYGGGAKATRAG